MKTYQDTETGMLHAVEDGVDPFRLNNRNIPTTLSETVIPKPSESHVWHEGTWVKDSEVPVGYKPPVSSVSIYNPAWISFLFPPGIVVLPDTEDKFELTLEQVNTNSYNGNKLSEIALTLPVVNGTGPLPALICYDGALAIPMNAIHSSAEIAVNTINRIMGAIFLGGICVEATDSRKIECGSLSEGGRNIFSNMTSAHNRLRNNCASITEVIVLSHPKIIRESEFRGAYLEGNKVLDAINNFSPAFLLRGHSALRDWNVGDALSNLWIVVEQLTCFLWEHRFLAIPDFHPKKMKNRIKSLKQDNRTWSTSVKHEILWQAKELSEDCYAALSLARKARNDLVHEGKIPAYVVVENLWIVLFELLETASGVSLNGMRQSTTFENPITRKRAFLKHMPPGFPDSGQLPKTNFDEWPAFKE